MSQARGIKHRVLKNLNHILSGGERVVHLYPDPCFYAHLSIYEFAAALARDRVVLDAGAGTGYGSAYLAEQGARQVCGVDVSGWALAFARKHFVRPNLRFEVQDLRRLAGLPDRAFDLVVSSNVLEHVDGVPAFLRSAWRLLRPDGTVLIAVPPLTTPEARAVDLANPFHLNSWSPRQWHHVLGRFFADIRCHRHFGRDDDYWFEPVALEQLYTLPTLTALFTVRGPRPERELPGPREPMEFVDDSFSRRANRFATLWHRMHLVKKRLCG